MLISDKLHQCHRSMQRSETRCTFIVLHRHISNTATVNMYKDFTATTSASLSSTSYSCT